MNDKIIDLESLPQTLNNYRKNNKKIVLCHGVFDLLHIGHIRHFNEAKKLGDILIVSITADKWVNKGPNRPAFSQDLRAEAIASLQVVDFVYINHDESAVPAIEAIKPNLYVKGKDYADRPSAVGNKLSLEESTVKKYGGSLVFTDDVQYSSSNLLNKFFPQFTPDIDQYLSDFRSRHKPEDVLEFFEKAKKLKVLVVGETIIDDYHYVEAIGKAGKEPVIVTRSMSNEIFAGGILAIANHVAGFCEEVDLLSYLGTVNSHESFVRGKLKPNVQPTFLFQKDKPTITKLRYLDNYLLQKLFEVYFINDDPLISSEEKEFLSILEKILPKYDLVIVADYGHGMISRHAIELLCTRSKFLAVNTQSNAGNKGLHTISRYPRADYVSISDSELRLELRRRDGDAHELLEQLIDQVSYPTITVTRGKHGILCFNRELGFAEGPGFTQSFVDRIGSGDAVLSVTSPIAALGAPPDIIALVGNLAGTEAVKMVGHRSSLEYSSFKRYLTSLLK